MKGQEMGADDKSTNEGQQGTGEPEGTANPTTPAGDGEQGQNPTPPASNGDTGEATIKDSHGQPGINKERHDREVKELQDKITELQSQLDAASESKESREAMGKRIDELQTQLADSEVKHSLEMAGCVDVKAAKARLEDFDGDVSKLKESCPYLFGQEKKTGSTGGKPAGTAKGDIDDKLDKAFGLK